MKVLKLSMIQLSRNPWCTRRIGRLLVAVHFVVMTVAMSMATPVNAAGSGTDPGAVASENQAGDGESYWGSIPARSDSIAAEAEFQKTPRPAWEYPLLVPYYIIKVPG